MSTDLLKQIDDLVASKTFNLDALDGIKKLKENLTTTLAERDVLKVRVEELNKELSSLRNDNKWQASRIEALNAKIKNNEETVEKSTAALYDVDKHKAVAEAWKEAMQTVFRPSSVRETVWQSVPISQHSNGYSTVMSYQQETKTTKEEL